MTDFVSPCQCTKYGFCPVHKRTVSKTRWNQCRTEPGIFEALSKSANYNPEIQPPIPPLPLGEGPGTELKKLLEAEGIPSCSACLETARRMNELGPEKCIESLEELVEEILPRAREWVSQNYKWSKALPSFAKDPIIRERIRENIKKAVTNFRESQQRRSL